IKQHVRVGGDTLENARQYVGQGTFMDMAADIARFHHEKFDGTGYCEGLRGQEIPLAARIVALADVYDALTTPRVYKPAYSPEASRDIIVRDSGTHFDPAVVAAFYENFEQFRQDALDPTAWLPSVTALPDARNPLQAIVHPPVRDET